MSSEIKLPELGENITAGDVIKVMVKVGETIAANQAVLEIETDKAAIEVPSPQAGVVEAILVKVGEKASVGQTILTLSGSTFSGRGADLSPKPTSPLAKTSAPSKTGFAALPKTSPSALGASSAVATPVAATAMAPLSTKIPASPALRRLAREKGLDLTKMLGSGSAGRFQVSDLQGGPAPIPLPDFSRWGEVSLEPMSNVRRLTAEKLGRSWPQVPQVTHFDKADITALEAWRGETTKKSSGVKITVTAILLKVVAQALQKFPTFNASVDMKQKQIVLKKYLNIGVAVDSERGLLVPVLRQVETKSVIELAKELHELSEKARNKKIHPDEMQGGNFTISNLGGIGGVGFSPIVNAPEVAILGVSRGQLEPRYIGKNLEPRFMLPLSLSYDHRLIDGANAARFLRFVVETLEEPKSLS